MRKVTLDGGVCTQRVPAMAALETALELPDWWGKNLDALCDCLWEIGEVSLLVKNRSALLATPFGRALWQALADTARENPRFSLEAARRLRLRGPGGGRYLCRAGFPKGKGRSTPRQCE